MEDGHYILPGELAILLAFLILPPLLVASPAQLLFLRRRRVSSSRAWLSLLVTAVVSAVVTIALFIFGSGLLPHALGVQDIFLGHRWFPVLPLAFVVVAFVSSSVSLWAGRRRA
jgi:hypothetical protein